MSQDKPVLDRAKELMTCFYLSQGFMEAPEWEQLGKDFQQGFLGLAALDRQGWISVPREPQARGGSPDEKGGSHAAELSSAVDVMPGASHPDKHAPDISALVGRLERATSWMDPDDFAELCINAAAALRALETERDEAQAGNRVWRDRRDAAMAEAEALQSELDRVRKALADYEAAYPFGRLGEQARTTLGERG